MAQAGLAQLLLEPALMVIILFLEQLLPLVAAAAAGQLPQAQTAVQAAVAG